MNLFKRIAAAVVCTSILVSTLGGLAVNAEKNTDTEICGMKTESLTNPLGLDDTVPTFGWKLTSDTRGVIQVSYRIRVSVDEDMTKLVWDSGDVKSDKSINIMYEGEQLKPSTRYYWNVTVEDNSGNYITSETNWFETGLMGTDASVWSGAEWIGSPMNTVNTDSLKDSTISVDFRIVSGDTAGIITNARDKNNYVLFEIDQTDKQLRVYQIKDNAWGNAVPTKTQLGNSPYAVGSLNNGTNSININQYGRRITVSINSTVIINGEYIVPGNINRNPRTEGLMNIGFCQENGCAAYDNMTVTKNNNQRREFDMQKSDFSDGNSVLAMLGTVKDGELVVENETRLINPVPSVNVRKSFNADKEIDSARLYASARGFYDAYINGRKINDSFYNPGYTDYNKRIFYQTYDVTDNIKQGVNVIGATVAKGYYSGYSDNPGSTQRYGKKNSFIGKLVINYTDGTRDIIVTDDTWQFTDMGPVLSGDYREGEMYDSRLEFDWNDLQDERWGVCGVEAWPSESFNSVNGEKIENEKFELCSENGVSARLERIIECTDKNPTQNPKGHLVYDLGQNMVGTVRIKAKAECGTQIKIRYSEMRCDGDTRVYLTNLRSAANTDTYVFKGDPNGEIIEPSFVEHGFRYIEISGDGCDFTKEQLNDMIISIEGLVITNTPEETGEFECSNPLINQLQSNIQWGQRGNSVLIYTDCPQRDERMGWTGDVQIFAPTGAYNMDIYSFMNKWLQDLRDAVIRNNYKGLVPDVAPVSDQYQTIGGGGWGDAAVIVPWELYQAYGCESVLEENYEMMKGWVDYQNLPERQNDGTRIYRGTTLAQADLAVNYPYIQRDDRYGDWVGVDQSTPIIYTATAYAAHSADILSKTAEVLGKTEDVQKYRQRFEDIKNAFNEAWVQEDGSIAYWGEMSRNGICSTRYSNADGSVNKPGQTAYALAIDFDLLPHDKLGRAYECLKEAINVQEGKLSVGFLGISHLAPALIKAGLKNETFNILENEDYPGWLYSVKNGATTIWERWNSYIAEGEKFGPSDMNSFNHYSFGAIGAWMFSDVLGIDNAEPGYKKINLKPIVGGGLTYAKGNYESVYGTICSDWSIDGTELTYRCTVPANTTATLYLPTHNAGVTTESGIPAAAAEGVTYKETDGDRAVYELESGSYSFTTYYNRNIEERTITIENPENVNAYAVIGGEKNKLPLKNFRTDNEALKTMKIVCDDDVYQFAYFNGDMFSANNPTINEIPDNAVLSAHFRYDSGTLVTPIVAGDKNISIVAGDIDTDNNLLLNKPVSSNNSFESERYGWLAAKLTDGVKTGIGYSSNEFDSVDAGSNAPYVEVDLGENQELTTLMLYKRTDNGSVYFFPEDFKVECRADGESEYKTLAEVTGCENTGEPVRVDFTKTSMRYVRVTAVKLSSNKGSENKYRFQVIEIEGYNLDDGDSQIFLANGEKMTFAALTSNRNISWYVMDGDDVSGKAEIIGGKFIPVRDNTNVTAVVCSKDGCGMRDISIGDSSQEIPEPSDDAAHLGIAVSADRASVSVTPKNCKNGILIAAKYRNGRLEEIKTSDYDENTTLPVTFKFNFGDINVRDNAEIKLMLWDSLNSMHPLCGTKRISLSPSGATQTPTPPFTAEPSPTVEPTEIPVSKKIVITEDMVTGSTSYRNNSAYDAKKAADGNYDTYFDGLANGYVQIDLGDTYRIDSIGYVPRAGYEYRMCDGMFYGSENGSDWELLYTVPSENNPKQSLTKVELNKKDRVYRYIKYTVPDGKEPYSGRNEDYVCNIAEIELYGERTTLYVPINDNISVTANSSYRNTPADNILDNRTDTYWSSNWSDSSYNPQSKPFEIIFDLGEKRQISRLTYTPRKFSDGAKDSGDINGVITEFKLMYSEDGQNYSEAAEGVLGYSNYNPIYESKTITFNPVKARYIKLVPLGNLYSVNSQWAYQACIGKMEFYSGSAAAEAVAAAHKALGTLIEQLENEADKDMNEYLNRAKAAYVSEYTNAETMSDFVNNLPDYMARLKSVSDAGEWSAAGNANCTYFARLTDYYSSSEDKVTARDYVYNKMQDFYKTGDEAAKNLEFLGEIFSMPEEQRTMTLKQRMDNCVLRAEEYLAEKDNTEEYIMLNELIRYIGANDKFGMDANTCEYIVNDINLALENLEKIDKGELNTSIAKVRSGEQWLDDKGSKISAHGGQVIKGGDGRYYWYGEDNKTGYDLKTGMSCYSSEDLTNWTYEGIVLDVRDVQLNPEFNAEFMTDDMRGTKGRLERPKVIYNEKTGKYVMWAHMEKDGGYALSAAGVAISDSPTGPFEWLYYGYPVWDKSVTYNSAEKQTYRDCNLFVDEDGTAYTFYASEGNKIMYAVRLNDEYTWIDTDNMTVKTKDELEALYQNGEYTDDETGLSYFDTTTVQYIAGKAASGNYNAYLPSFTGVHMYANARADDGSGNVIVNESGRWSRCIDNGDGTDSSYGGRDKQREAPAPMRVGENDYQLVTSGTSGWNPNLCRVHKSQSILGPWFDSGLFAPNESSSQATTYYSQPTCVLKMPEGSSYEFMYMGDRWECKGLGANDVKHSSYVWLPMSLDADGTMHINWQAEWDIYN